MIERDGCGHGFDGVVLNNGDGYGNGYAYTCGDGHGYGYYYGHRFPEFGNGYGYGDAHHNGGGICQHDHDDAIVAILKEEKP